LSLAPLPAHAGADVVRAGAQMVLLAPGSPVKGNPETAKLHARIDSGIVMLEAHQYREFLQAFVDPEFIEHKGVDAILEEFQEEKAELLLSVLKEIRTNKPSYRKGNTVASFKLRKRPDAHGYINFTRVDGVWYIKN